MIKMGGALQTWWRREATSAGARGLSGARMRPERRKAEDQSTRHISFPSSLTSLLCATSEFRSSRWLKRWVYFLVHTFTFDKKSKTYERCFLIADVTRIVLTNFWPHLSCTWQLTRRDIAHQGLQVEANATALVLKLVQLPAPSTSIGSGSAWQALLKRLLSVSIRVQGKGMAKTWMAEFVFYSSPLNSSHPKEQGFASQWEGSIFFCDSDAKLFLRPATTSLFPVRNGNRRYRNSYGRLVAERLGSDRSSLLDRSRSRRVL